MTVPMTSTQTTNDERDELRSVTRAFLAREVPPVDLRITPERGYPYDPAAWTSMSESLGLQGLIVPDELGGLAMGVRELAVVCEELGRALYNGPFLTSSVIASTLLAHGGNAASTVLAELATGETIATVLSELLPFDLNTTTFRASSSGDGDVLVSGRSGFVLGVVESSLLLVPTATDAGLVIVGVDAHAPGVRIETLDSLDLLRSLSVVTLENAPGRVVIDASTAKVALARAVVSADIGLAAESIGAAQNALEMTVAYVGNRVQFGRVIGGFQAVKHRCADMLVQLEGARSALFAALNAESASLDECQRVASLAKIQAADAFFYIAGETVHLHGGIGFTFEHPAHLYYRHAKASQLLFGGRAEHQRALFRNLLPMYQPERITE
jgi:alkylation response protein AidB-like acyl-CoA dehydrogenase